MVLARQSPFALPQRFEWIHDTVTSLDHATRDAGMTAQECPLLVLGSLALPPPIDGEARPLPAEHVELAPR
jgi:hypothetical protein